MTTTISDSGVNFGNSAAAYQITQIGASVAGNALTVTLPVCTIAFRSTTLNSGTVTPVDLTSTLSLTIPSGASLGTVNATQSRIVVLAINNANTVELAVVNVSGGNDLTETGLISTTAISGSATSASTIYSASARTNVAYRVVGYVESTQATAGTWAAAPSTVQGQGGQALAAMSSLGYGQTWQNVLGSRVQGTTYYNTTGKPIFVGYSGYSSAATGAVVVNGVTIYSSLGRSTYFNTMPVPFIVPPGGSYSISGHDSTATWTELR